MRKEFNSNRISLEHQYGRRDVMWKRSIRTLYLSSGDMLAIMRQKFEPRGGPAMCRTQKKKKKKKKEAGKHRFCCFKIWALAPSGIEPGTSHSADQRSTCWAKLHISINIGREPDNMIWAGSVCGAGSLCRVAWLTRLPCNNKVDFGCVPRSRPSDLGSCNWTPSLYAKDWTSDKSNYNITVSMRTGKCATGAESRYTQSKLKARSGRDELEEKHITAERAWSGN